MSRRRPPSAASEPGGALPKARLPCSSAPVMVKRTPSAANTDVAVKATPVARNSRRLTSRDGSLGHEAFFLQAPGGDGGAGIGLLQVHAPVAQGVERDMHTGDGAGNISAGLQHFVVSVQETELGLGVAFHLVHGIILKQRT